MATVYNVSVNPSKKEKDFTIAWLNKKTNKKDWFVQSAPGFGGLRGHSGEKFY